MCFIIPISKFNERFIEHLSIGFLLLCFYFKVNIWLFSHTRPSLRGKVGFIHFFLKIKLLTLFFYYSVFRGWELPRKFLIIIIIIYSPLLFIASSRPWIQQEAKVVEDQYCRTWYAGVRPRGLNQGTGWGFWGPRSYKGSYLTSLPPPPIPYPSPSPNFPSKYYTQLKIMKNKLIKIIIKNKINENK